MRAWGITGTNGKTTTTWILAEFLGADPSRKVGYVTTVEVFDGAFVNFLRGMATPEGIEYIDTLLHGRRTPFMNKN